MKQGREEPAALLLLVLHGGGQRLIALTNIASEDVTVDVGMLAAGPTRDLISKRVFAPGVVAMKPYDVLWLTPA